MTLEPKKRRGAPPPKGRENREHSGTLCTATRRDGKPCTNYARLASTVCRMHGGSAPQVVRAAQVRLLMAADRLMAQLLQIAEDKSEPTPVRLSAIRDALDRAGLGSKQEIAIEAKVETWETRIKGAVVDWGSLAALLPDDYDPNVIDAEVVEVDTPSEDPSDWSDYPSLRREHKQVTARRQAEALPVQPIPQPDEYQSLSYGEGGSQTATRLADEHRARMLASGGLEPKTRRKR